jgi:hypothetical protein
MVNFQDWLDRGSWALFAGMIVLLFSWNSWITMQLVGKASTDDVRNARSRWMEERPYVLGLIDEKNKEVDRLALLIDNNNKLLHETRIVLAELRVEIGILREVFSDLKIRMGSKHEDRRARK